MNLPLQKSVEVITEVEIDEMTEEVMTTRKKEIGHVQNVVITILHGDLNAPVVKRHPLPVEEQLGVVVDTSAVTIVEENAEMVAVEIVTVIELKGKRDARRIEERKNLPGALNRPRKGVQTAHEIHSASAEIPHG